MGLGGEAASSAYEHVDRSAHWLRLELLFFTSTSLPPGPHQKGSGYAENKVSHCPIASGR